MAKNEPNKPDDLKAAPEKETTAEEKAALVPVPEVGGEIPVPEMTTEEDAALTQEGEAALREMGEEQLEPPAPFDIGGDHIPDPGDVVVPFDKINEIISEKQEAVRMAEQTAAPERQKAEKSDFRD